MKNNDSKKGKVEEKTNSDLLDKELDSNTIDENFSEEFETDLNFAVDEQEQRIIDIIQDDALQINERTLRNFMNFLKENMEKPCVFTGIEDFDWEEKYIFGIGNEKEYEELKKTKPSYTDMFEFVEFEDNFKRSDLLIKVKRVSDKKPFTLQLSLLEVEDRDSKNYDLFHDFAVWITNYI